MVVEPSPKVATHSHRRGVKNRDVFPAASMDGFTAAQTATVRGHIYSGKFIFLSSAAYRASLRMLLKKGSVLIHCRVPSCSA